MSFQPKPTHVRGASDVAATLAAMRHPSNNEAQCKRYDELSWSLATRLLFEIVISS